jgi:hypothetical protein
MPLTTVAGRQTLPANDVAKFYAAQAGDEGGPLDFVVFVDARERQRQAFLSNEEAFRATHERTKWDLSQK